MTDVHICTTSYGAWLDDCKRRTKAGQNQGYCPVCLLWRWPDECEHTKRTKWQFNAMVRAAKATAGEWQKERHRDR